MKWFEIFKAGKYPQGEYTESDVDDIIQRFEEEPAGVPITIDHRKSGPAYGWVDKLKRQGDILLATFKNIPAEFKETVKNKLFRHVSVEIPKPGGRNRLRAVSFLGANTPEIKYLKGIEFSDDEDDIYIKFQEDEMTEEERLRQENADLRKQMDEKEQDVKKFSEESEKTKQELDNLKASVAKETEERRKTEIKEFCETKVKEGKLDPKELESTAQFMELLDDSNVAEFSEGDGKMSKKTPLRQYMGHVDARKADPALFNEQVNEKGQQRYDFSGEDGDDAKLFSEAEKLAKEKDIPVSDACKIVSAGK